MCKEACEAYEELSEAELHVFAGIGSQLQAFDLSSALQLCSYPALENGSHIHGLHACATDSGAMLSVHGDHFAKVCKSSSQKGQEILLSVLICNTHGGLNEWGGL